MDSTFYFYFGMMEQWMISNGAEQIKEKEAITFDQLPKDFW